MKRVMFIGQAPARPGSKNGVAGTYVRPWLYKIGLEETTIAEYFRFYALIDSFPGNDHRGHLRPTAEQVKQYRPVLIRLIVDFQPDVIVPVGAMAVKEVLPHAGDSLGDIVGSVYHTDPFESLEKEIIIIPLPHPSRRSTWLNANPDKVARSLQTLKLHIQ